MIRNAFTVDVEEYFQVEAFSDRIPKQDWHKFPSRVEETTTKLLELLDKNHVRGTFFVLGWIARIHPALVEKIYKAGHEIASHGFDHTMITEMTPEAFREDIRQSKTILEGIIGTSVNGYRAPTFSIIEKTSWAYQILLEEGYRYSSSVFPIRHDRYGWTEFGNAPKRMHAIDGKEIWEVPMSTWCLGSVNIPFGGGGYLRFYPWLLTKALFRKVTESGKPVMVYVHPWEFDTKHPMIDAPFLKRIRHHAGISGMNKKLRYLLKYFQFGTIEQYLEKMIASKSTHP
jgi:polysaccharide deacetylase family protein (PEP-CTERM system associated)